MPRFCRYMPSASHKVPPGYDNNCAEHQFGRSPDTAEVFVRDNGIETTLVLSAVLLLALSL